MNDFSNSLKWNNW